MNLEITVRGSAEERVAPQLAVLKLVVAAEGPEKQAVRDEVATSREPLVEHLVQLRDEGAVERWSSDQVRSYSHRPWEGDRRAEQPVHVARLQVEATFVDFAALDGFVDRWVGGVGVELQGIEWDLDEVTRRVHQQDVRRRAVDDAVAKAQAYSNAVRRGHVTVVQLADPGMLDRTGGTEGPALRMAAGLSRGGGDAGIELAPADVVIEVEVEGRFTAE